MAARERDGLIVGGSSATKQGASRQVTHLRLYGTAERLIAEGADEVGGGRGHPLAVAGLGAERSRAPLASLGSHCVKEACACQTNGGGRRKQPRTTVFWEYVMGDRRL